MTKKFKKCSKVQKQILVFLIKINKLIFININIKILNIYFKVNFTFLKNIYILNINIFLNIP